MLAGMDLRTVEDVLWALSSFDRILRGSGLDLSVGELMRGLGDAYPAVFGEETFGAMEDQAIIWNERTRDALDRKSRIENMVIGEMFGLRRNRWKDADEHQRARWAYEG
jgi:hypothetical protein